MPAWNSAGSLRRRSGQGRGAMIMAAVLLALAAARAGGADEETAKNVILFIGNGMGQAAVTAARLYAGGSSGRLAMEQLPVTGFSRTYSSNNFVTDSAAGGTALACGVKTYNGAIGMSDKQTDPSGQSRPLQSLTDLARAQGKSVGVISTAKVTDATPACFYARADKRSKEAAIAAQATTAGLTLLMGGGRIEFHGPDWQDPESGKPGTRGDKRDVVKEMEARGYRYVQSADELKKLDPGKPGLKLLGLFEGENMQNDLERPKDKLGEPSLAEMTEFAIKLLSQNPKGYFLMVEGAKIDKTAHANDARNEMGEMAAFDKAIGAAERQAGAETLIVVTADHETGGLAISGYAPREQIQGEALLGNVPSGGEQPKPGQPAPMRGILSYATGPGARSPEAVEPQKPNFAYKAAYWMQRGAAHTAVDVPVMAGGPGAIRFTGYQNNNEIAWKIAGLMGKSFNEAANIENRNAVK